MDKDSDEICHFYVKKHRENTKSTRKMKEILPLSEYYCSLEELLLPLLVGVRRINVILMPSPPEFYRYQSVSNLM